MKLEERGLTPIFSYINARLTRRPLHTGIWTIIMLIILASILKLDADRGKMGDVLIFDSAEKVLSVDWAPIFRRAISFRVAP